MSLTLNRLLKQRPSLRQIIIPIVSLGFIAVTCLFPLFNGFVLGRYNSKKSRKNHHIFPHPFMLAFLQSFFATVMLLILALIEYCIWSREWECFGKNPYKIIGKVRDPLTSRIFGVYGHNQQGEQLLPNILQPNQVKKPLFDGTLTGKIFAMLIPGILLGIGMGCYFYSALDLASHVDFLCQSFIVLIVTVFTEEKPTPLEILCAVGSILGMIPFVLNPGTFSTKWIIAFCLDLGATILYSFVLILLRKICVEYKKSELKYDAVQEPTLTELSLYFCFWSSVVTLFLALILDLLVDAVFSSAKSPSLSDCFQDATTMGYVVLCALCLLAQSWCTMGMATVGNAVTMAVLNQLCVVSQVLLTYEFFRESRSLEYYHWLGLSFVVLCTLFYCYFRVKARRDKKSVLHSSVDAGDMCIIESDSDAESFSGGYHAYRGSSLQ